MKLNMLLFGLLAATPAAMLAQTTPLEAGKAYTAAHKQELTKQFEEFLSMPNVAADPAGLKKNAEFLKAQLEKRGFEARLLTAPGLPEGTPYSVWGEMKTPGAKRTIVLYAHYDGQPVTPSEWENGKPFTPVEKMVDGQLRVYARSAGDDKDSIFAQLTAYDALKAAGIPLKANIRFVWEGEEENGSTHFAKILASNHDLVTGDVWLFCDGPTDQTGKPIIAFGTRGDAHLQVTIFGPHRALHSGHYGNWAPNPALALVQLLAGMKDGNGKVLIPHFYDGMVPMGPLDLKAMAEAPVNDNALRKELWLGRTDGGGKHLIEMITYPSLNINGISSGQTGPAAANVIPISATANLDMRLPLGIDWKVEQDRVIDYVKSQGYYVTATKPTQDELLSHPHVAWIERNQGENAARTPLDTPIAVDVVRAVNSTHGPAVLVPTSGATGPEDAMEKATGSKVIHVSMANHDDNQHAANENLVMQNLWDGVDMMAALIAMP
ncbi:M20/M25/M40 family metallo-hydrolase [Granulicella sp. WH15]|uniref:M20/M25/M40 family metallo-hydrolase n=1 Tax=Granulicella sp. WH15 TaxID=2602070 RepID=UPI002106AF15|nr:M20/M25/M40 family metallo-hydrolase [Granulicella sp. WH15]